METHVLDSITRAFGAFGEDTSTALDLATGCLRGVAEIDEFWSGLDLARVLDDVAVYPGTQGTPGLLAAASDLVGQEWGAAIPPERIVAVHGAFDGLAHALSGLPDRAVVLVPAPGFDIRLAVIRAGCRPQPLVWRLGSSVGDLLTEVERAADETGAAALVLNLPRNPDGVTATSQEWDDLIRTVRETGMRLVLDDVYSFTTQRRRPPGLLDNPEVVVVESLSKRLGAPGLRAGFVVAPQQLMPTVRASVAAATVGLARPVAHVAEEAIRFWLSHDLGVVVRQELHRRSDVLLREVPAWLRERLLLKPGYLYAVLAVGDEALVTRMLARAGMRVTPGRALALGGSGEPTSFVRLCLGGTADTVTVANLLGRTLTDQHVDEGGPSAAY